MEKSKGRLDKGKKIVVVDECTPKECVRAFEIVIGMLSEFERTCGKQLEGREGLLDLITQLKWMYETVDRQAKAFYADKVAE